MNSNAQWIWNRQASYHEYNDAAEFRWEFEVSGLARARVLVTADSWYRLYINGEWVGDGPGRSWPSHYQYDVLDVTQWIREGTNEIRAVARYFGIGTFHQVPCQAGFLAQVEIEEHGCGQPNIIVTDEKWEARPFHALRRDVPKTSVQMEAFETYDARLEDDAPFAPAAALCGANEGPWKDLHPRDCALLTREPFTLKRFTGATVVDGGWTGFGFAAARVANPGLIEANAHTSNACVFAAELESPKACDMGLSGPGLTVTVNGDAGKDGVFSVKKGQNFVLVAVTSFFSHWTKDCWMRVQGLPDGSAFRNLLDPSEDNPWCSLVLDAFRYAEADNRFSLQPKEQQQAVTARIANALREVITTARDRESFLDTYGMKARCMPAEKMLFEEAYEPFAQRMPLGDAAGLVDRPAALMSNNADNTLVYPAAEGDVELAYDFGEQNCGYVSFDIQAHEGTVLDIMSIEFIAPDGDIQHTAPYRCGMRYVCKEGVNRFTSFKRRSQRHLYLTLRNQKAPVALRQVRLVESTYPVEARGSFACSDIRLDRIWEISARTLKLCMEDSFTDCPLYEQTLWVGDARNEGVFAMTAFGAEDIVARCIRIAAQSLERHPIVLCQVPSAWDTLIPAWSFLWGISVWDYYLHTGDKGMLDEMWPHVLKNLDGAATFTDERGLFSAPFWNMFDWTPVDDLHSNVLHNSMFMVGALDAAISCGKVLGEKAAVADLRKRRAKLAKAVQALWDPKKKVYPDSIHDDGKVSQATCVHTSFLALLYDICPKDLRPQLLKNVLKPAKGTVGVGSPFAILYLYEALEKEGALDEVVQSIYQYYLPMIEAGATTVWETLPGSNIQPGKFPTRSHCHAWSSAPVHFLNRIVLGIRPAAPGGSVCDIGPWVKGLDWARGGSVTGQGIVEVAWKKEGKSLHIEAEAPAGVRLRYVPNPSHKGLDVFLNGKRRA